MQFYIHEWWNALIGLIQQSLKCACWKPNSKPAKLSFLLWSIPIREINSSQTSCRLKFWLLTYFNYVSFISDFRRLADRLDAAKPKTHLNKRIDWNESPRTRKPVSPTLLSVVCCVLLFRAMSEISIVPRLHSSTSTLQYSCSICSKCGVKELSAAS